MKTIELTPILNAKVVTLPLGILLIYAGIYSGISNGAFNIPEITYILVGIFTNIFSFEKQLFGVLRYIKYNDNKLIYKRTPFSSKQIVDVNEIKIIKFYGSKIYISSENKILLVINIDLIRMESRFELRDFFIQNFKEKVIFTPQDNIFVERYKRKLKQIEERQKQKNEQ
jgi:hypothetical protein